MHVDVAQTLAGLWSGVGAEVPSSSESDSARWGRSSSLSRGRSSASRPYRAGWRRLGADGGAAEGVELELLENQLGPAGGGGGGTAPLEVEAGRLGAGSRLSVCHSGRSSSRRWAKSKKAHRSGGEGVLEAGPGWEASPCLPRERLLRGLGGEVGGRGGSSDRGEYRRRNRNGSNRN